MKLLIHIGTHKTATTSFQKICFNERKTLIREWINFPNYKNYQNHNHIAWLSQKNDITELKFFLKSIYEDSLNLKCKLTMISGEDFENFLIDIHHAKTFIHIANEVGFKEIEWVLVYRDPLEYLQSIYSEMCKHYTVLNYETMGMLITDCGYVSLCTPGYNYHFVFKINKFAEIFKKNVSKNLILVPFISFIEDFPGKVILSKYLSDHSKEKLKAYAHSIYNENKRLEPEIVEFNYIANFLGVHANQKFYDTNKELLDLLIKKRINTNNKVIHSLKKEFEKIKL